jgi:hypothetical protein
MPRQNRSFLIGTLAMLAITPTVQGGYLDPAAFTSLGTLNLTSGNYTINTSGVPTLLDSSNNVLFTGTTYVQGGSFDSTVSVLDFSSINIGTGVNIRITGDNPLALLSQANAQISGTLNANGFQGDNSNAAIFGGTGDGLGGAGGPGGGKGGDGTTPGQTGTGPGGGPGGPGGIGAVQAAGGSFGGMGGMNALGLAGPTYGNLYNLLQGGSGGGATGTSAFESIGGGGGGGGGAVELGALGSITFFGPGTLEANGGNSGSGFAANAGAGSGGGLLIHAPTIDLEYNSSILAQGGTAFGGGGRILFLTDSGTVLNSGGSVSAAAGGGIDNQQSGTVDYGFLTPASVPEPASIIMVAIGGLGVVVLSRVRRRPGCRGYGTP